MERSDRMDKFEFLYREEHKRAEQLQGELNQIQADYAHLKAVHDILIHRLKTIVESGENR
jgi:hypothetical protein